MFDLICCFISGIGFGMAVTALYFKSYSKYWQKRIKETEQDLFDVQYELVHLKHKYIRRRDPKTGRFMK
jgi:hypothetical protein